MLVNLFSGFKVTMKSKLPIKKKKKSLIKITEPEAPVPIKTVKMRHKGRAFRTAHEH